jgi:hypothetical protein
MPSQRAALGAQALGQGMGAFSNALLQLMERKAREERWKADQAATEAYREGQLGMSQERVDLARAADTRGAFSTAADLYGEGITPTAEMVGQPTGTDMSAFAEPPTDVPTATYRGLELPMGTPEEREYAYGEFGRLRGATSPPRRPETPKAPLGTPKFSEAMKALTELYGYPDPAWEADPYGTEPETLMPWTPGDRFDIARGMAASEITGQELGELYTESRARAVGPAVPGRAFPPPRSIGDRIGKLAGGLTGGGAPAQAAEPVQAAEPMDPAEVEEAQDLVSQFAPEEARGILAEVGYSEDEIAQILGE